jgi:hypothetical protein
MSQEHGELSFLDDLRAVIQTLGGRHAASGFCQELVAIADEVEQEIHESAIAAFGGRHTTNPLGQALVAMVDNTPLPEEHKPKVVKTLEAPKPRKVNLTAQWLASNGTKTRRMLVDYLGQKLQTSRQIDVVEDHVQTFLCRLVEKDQLAPYLELGKPIQPGVLRVWAYQSACTEIRGWGVDASLRQSRGAKTHRDRQADAGKLPVVAIHSTESAVERRYEVENGEVVSDLFDPHAEDAEDALVSAETLERAREVVLRKIAGAGPRYAALFDALVDGGKRATLASEAGVSRNRMASMLSRIREVLRDDDTLSAS